MAQARRNRKNKTPAWVWLIIGVLLGFFFSHVNFRQAYLFIETAIEKNQKTVQTGRQPPKEETKFDFYNILSEKGEPSHIKMNREAPKIAEPKTKVEALRQPPELQKTVRQKSETNPKMTPTPLPPLEKRSIIQLPVLKKSEKTLSPKEAAKAPNASTHIIPIKEKELKKAPEGKLKHSVESTLQIAALKGYAEADRLKAQLLLLGFQGIQIQKVKKGTTIWYRVTVGNYPTHKEAEAARKKLQQNNVNSMIVPK